MGVNISLANAQANDLRTYANQLSDLKTKLENYKCTLDQNWKSKEVEKIDSAIITINGRIENLKRDLNNIATNIVQSASDIRKEEIEAERRRQEMERKRAEAAKIAAEKAKEEKSMKELLEKINKIKNKTQKNSLLAKAKENGITSKELEEYYKKIVG